MLNTFTNIVKERWYLHARDNLSIFSTMVIDGKSATESGYIRRYIKLPFYQNPILTSYKGSFVHSLE